MKLSDLEKVGTLKDKLEDLQLDLATVQPDAVHRIIIHRKGYHISDARVSVSSDGFDDETAAFVDALIVIRKFIQERIDKTRSELEALGVTVD